MDASLFAFEQYLKRRFGHSTTPKHYLSDLHIFFGSIGQKPPESITAADVDMFVENQIALGLSPASINRHLSCLHTFFEYLASQQLEQAWPNPVIARRHRLKMGSHLPRDVHDADVERLLACITQPRDQAIFSLMLGAGLRVGEIATLHLDQLEPPPSPQQLAKLRVKGKGNKERMVWLPPTAWDKLLTWLVLRPPVDHDYLFLNQRGRPITISGIQYRLTQYSQTAEVTVSCHRLRHTFARRLAENGLPVDSLAKLLGHTQLQTTQRYIDGADPTVRADFRVAMSHLETSLGHPLDVSSPQTAHMTAPQPRSAPQAQLTKLLQQVADLPSWLAEAVEAYLKYHWPTWKGQTAYELGHIFSLVVKRMWQWLARHRSIQGWATFHRIDLEAWLQARSQEAVTAVTIQNDLRRFRSLLRFLEARDYPLDPGLFRVKPPKTGTALPRYLPEGEYRRLEAVVLRATPAETDLATFDRAWFLTLAHTGLRLSELLDWRLDDLNVAAGYAMVRGGKPGRDRVVYLTPPLIDALGRYLNQRPDLPENDHVFVSHGRSPVPRTIQRRLTDYGQRAGVAVSPHRLRHTFATRLINQGMPISSLRKLLGHQHLNTTQIYAQIYDETLYNQFRATMGALEAIAMVDWPQRVEIQRESVET